MFKFKSLNFSCLVFFVLIIANAFSQETSEVTGKIQVIKNDNFITLKGEVVNEGILFVDELSYNLVALKKDKNGNYSNNKQAGEFSLKPNEKKELAIIRLNINKGEQLKAFLFVKHKEVLVSRDTFLIKDNDKLLRKNEKINESSFVMKGLVIDEAITKIGKDFYDFFYQTYLLSGIKYPFIIKIKEKPGLTRTTNISVEVEDTLVFEFRSNPNEDYLKEIVNVSLARLRVYARQRETLKNQKI